MIGRIHNTKLHSGYHKQTTNVSDCKFSLEMIDKSTIDQQKTIPQAIKYNLEQFLNNWNKSEALLAKRLKSLAPENRKLIELQISVHQINLLSNVGAHIGEGASNTIKRLHQMGSGN